MNKEDNFDDAMEQQIGDIGGTKSLGKLKHAPTGKKELNQDEKTSLADFEHSTREHFTNNVADGWIPIERSDMGTRSQFYPEDWEFRVRPATVEAIKNWSSIDETNLSVVNNVMNEIIKQCVSIRSDSGTMAWDKINSWDRFWFILKVREYTFSQGEQAMVFDEECDTCGQNIHYVLESDSLFYEFPDDEVVERHWDASRRTWVIDPKDYDVPGENKVYLYVPTLGKDQAILGWMYAQNEAGKTLDETFIKFLPYMLEKAPKDPTLLDKMIRDCQKTYRAWDSEMFDFMDEVRRNITINPSEKLTQKCPNCGEEVHSTVRFPNGIKYLFTIQGKHRKFGTK